MANRKLVIVESPTKAKTIRKFLGKDFIVESCMGHIRDLPQSAKDIPEKYKKQEWATLGVNVDKEFEPIYCIPNSKTKVVKSLKDKLAESNELYLATDEDREGESISWHLVEVLKPKVPIKRMVFHEITETAIKKSLKETRDIDYNLVKAQEARRILDRLVGYTISPLLWKKIAFGLSAGRVQSVAVTLISTREHERFRFKKSNYAGLTAQLEKDKIAFDARLQSLSNKRIATGKDFDGLTGLLTKPNEITLLNDAEAEKLSGQLATAKYQVTEVEERPVNRRPAAPFITSTLQQEANRKLGLSSREAMQVAQKLYEQGYITYMRTDSTFLSKEAELAARNCIEQKYGLDYLPSTAISYTAKQAKGAQEAHEAIRPAGAVFKDPAETDLDGIQLKLYDLIWKRTVASQMVDARQKQVSSKIRATVSGVDAVFTASGMTIEFPGFLRAYVEGSDDPEAELAEREIRLPKLISGDLLLKKALVPTSHETKPPARYTEASLVQMMEREGIGRPSTYASIIGTIIDRGYVRKVANALVPTFTALVVSKLLQKYLERYVDLQFTSQMEKSLDDIADGDLDSIKYLNSVYFGKTGLKENVGKQSEVIDPEEARSIKLEGLDAYTFKVGRFGAYVETKRDGLVVSASIPDADAPADINAELADKWIDQKIKGADALGIDPTTGLKIYVLSGRYGPYVQLGESNAEADKPKRVSLMAGMVPETVTLPQALDLLSLPKKLGVHPELQKEIKAGLGRFGPYIVCDGDYRSIPKHLSLFQISFDEALELLKQPKKGRGKKAPLKEFVHPGAPAKTADHQPGLIQLLDGPYGPYLKIGKKNVSLPEGVKVDDVTLEKAVEIVGAYDADDEVTSAKKSAAKKSGAKRAATKTPAATKSDSQAKAKADARLNAMANAKVNAKPKAEEGTSEKPSKKLSKKLSNKTLAKATSKSSAKSETKTSAVKVATKSASKAKDTLKAIVAVNKTKKVSSVKQGSSKGR